MPDKKLGEHIFVFNKEDNGGESLTLKTEFFDNGDGGEDSMYVNQTLTLMSYGNSASFNLCGTGFSPEILRELADQLEAKKKSLL